MLSKNNFNELIRKQEPKKQRFTIKKLTVGVASVLIGFTFMGVSAANADADVPTAPAQTETAATPTGNQNSASASSATPAGSAQNSNAASSAAADTNENTLNISNNAQPAVDPSQLGASLREETPTQAFDLQSFTGALVNKNVHEIQLTSDINFNDNQTNLVSGGTGIGANGLKPYELAANKVFFSPYDNIAHTVVIDGQGHSLNMGKWFISLWNQNYGDGSWHITFKNLKLNQENASYSPIYFGNASTNNQKKSSLTFDGVTANVARTLNTYDAANVAIHFKGNNTVKVENMPQKVNAVNGSTVDFSDGTTNFDINGDALTGVSEARAGNWGNSAVYASSTDSKNAIVINHGATVKITSKSQDFRGLTADATTNQVGGLTVKGDLKIDLTGEAKDAEGNARKAGHGTAIWVGSLYIDGGNVDIKTMQDNQADGVENSWINGTGNYNGTHYGVVALGVGQRGGTFNSNPTLNISNNGQLRITRGNVKTLTQLITFGSGGTRSNSKQVMNVGDGAILDLQDGAATPEGFSDSYGAQLGNPGSIFYPGMIHMFGNGSTDTLSFGNVKYVNLQRTGNQRGVLISLEGGKDGLTHGFNQTSLNNQMPLAQWMFNNTGVTPDHAWLINGLTTQNGTGNTDVNFVPAGNQPDVLAAANYGKLFGESNGSVDMAPIQRGANAARYNSGNVYGTNGSVNSTKTASYLQNFLDNFNWWTPRRIAFGTQLLNNPNVVTDADKFSPETHTINTDTSKKLSDLNVKMVLRISLILIVSRYQLMVLLTGQRLGGVLIGLRLHGAA